MLGGSAEFRVAEDFEKGLTGEGCQWVGVVVDAPSATAEFWFCSLGFRGKTGRPQGATWRGWREAESCQGW